MLEEFLACKERNSAVKNSAEIWTVQILHFKTC